MKSSDNQLEVTAKTIRDAVASDQAYPEFQRRNQNTINQLWMADCEVMPDGQPFSEENYKQLLMHFGLPYSHRGIFALSLVLALKHVRGFDTEMGGAGRPEQWKPFHYALLFSWVHMKCRQNPKKSLTQAIREASVLNGHLPSTKNLRGIYYDADKFIIIKEYDEWLCHRFNDNWPEQFNDGGLVIDSNSTHERFSRVFPCLRAR